jgi:hypothetical protein
MTFATAVAVGETTSAGGLRDAIGSVAVLAGDISITSLGTFVDCPGLAVPVDGQGLYALDGFIAYSTGVTPDIEFVFSAPPATTGHFSFMPQYQTATGGVGAIEGFRQLQFADQPQGAAGVASGSMVAMPHGWCLTRRLNGAIQLRFRQATSTASTTTVLAGSWLRASLIGHFLP